MRENLRCWQRRRHTYIYACASHTHTCIHTLTRTHTRTHTHAYTHTHAQLSHHLIFVDKHESVSRERDAHTYIYTHIITHTHTLTPKHIPRHFHSETKNPFHGATEKAPSVHKSAAAQTAYCARHVTARWVREMRW